MYEGGDTCALRSSAQRSVMTYRGEMEGVRGRFKEGTYVYFQLVHFVVQQKLMQHCKAIILQLKKNLKNELYQETKSIPERWV